MYTKEGKLQDRREMLRVKIKSLAAESKMIRAEEKKTKGILRTELHLHRVNDVRYESRYTHIAYGLIRGYNLEQIEPHGKKPINWTRVKSMIAKYGPSDPAAKQLLIDKCK